jgi:hypothetical protein
MEAIRGELIRQQRPLIERIEALVGRIESAADRAEESGQTRQLLDAARELRGFYELIGRVTGELKPDGANVTINVLASADWLRLRGVMFSALEPFPAARVAVAEAVAQLEQ